MAVSGPPRIPGAPLLPFLLVALCCCFQDLRSDARTLDRREVAALKLVAEKLKIPQTLWNFSVDPCRDWVPTIGSRLVSSNLTCGDCNTATNVCHVVNIELRGQNLTGVLPEEFGNLTSLTKIDLSRNYINGTIPATAWTSLPLRIITLVGNRLSGPIPEAIGKITTLQSLVLDDNMLQGSLPRALGSLTNLATLILSANNFTGELPETLGNLKNLVDFRINGNDISGKLPSFIGNWTKLDRLDMQGTSLEGPFPIFPQTITQLRISDLKKADGSFPPVQNMLMRNLILRNCSMSGPIPEYLGTMASLDTLDLSFNSLTGAIPSSFENLRGQISKMYLNSNKLTGSIPIWIRTSTRKLDVSDNTFTDITSAPKNCRADNHLDACLRKGLPCSGKAKNYQLFINCGGSKVTVDNNEYEGDTSPQGPSTYYLSESGRWAYSSTGDLMSESDLGYIEQNASVLTMPEPRLYMSARFSPLSLKYYGLCLQNGNYTVKLHFAEIIFTDDQTFLGVGRRVFDVSIQGKKVLKDFNIAEVANGASNEVTKSFTTLVEDNTLEIHFQWGGKGTNAVPYRGVHGPLISAISVTPNFRPKLDENKFPVAAIVGTIVGSCVLAVLILAIFLWFWPRRKNIEKNEIRDLQLLIGYFSLKKIKAATRNFDPSNKIGEGGFGQVYKGVLPDGSLIAVKQLSSKSKQGSREFVNEIVMISALQHPNLVKLLGCCIEGSQLFLIYEYMENNSLARALFGSEGINLTLDWQTRRKICLGIARGLAYLHEESRLKIVHRDIKATNILLDEDLNAKISDFGLAKLDEHGSTHISTRIAGTMGYMAPEYAMKGYLTDKADVYSFGVLTLEIITGKSNTNYLPEEYLFDLLDWAHMLQKQGSLHKLVDPVLATNYSEDEALQLLNVSLVCTNKFPLRRPPMSTVVSMLEGRTPVRVPSMEYRVQVTHADGDCVNSSSSTHSSREYPS
ncbi:hypothetical protein Taro_028142 [Colocasia esculenta]|uniref:non-specific serine/threonine protein kinase n=1 Tax=Colocasia esculenta TaxID=4460 RepID=A0A843VAG7_COLES|nr:hypothetical protein [Colocasia esculenta]